MSDVAIMYGFRASDSQVMTIRLTLSDEARREVAVWLGGRRQSPLTIDSQSARMSRASIGGGAEKPRVYGVAIEQGGRIAGLTNSTAERWEKDLEADSPGVYETVSDDQTVPIR